MLFALKKYYFALDNIKAEDSATTIIFKKKQLTTLQPFLKDNDINKLSGCKLGCKVVG